MICLAVDTTGTHACASAADERGVLSERMVNAGRTHSEVLLALIDEVLSEAKLAVSDVDLFCSVVGPGSFTGIRIGVLTVKALAHALHKPCAGLSALEVLREGAAGAFVCAMLDARNDQVYAAAYQADGAVYFPEAALSVSDFFDKLPDDGEMVFVGDGAIRHEGAIRARFGARARIAHAYARPGDACKMALRGEGITDYLSLTPEYLRAPQAERERAARHG